MVCQLPCRFEGGAPPRGRGWRWAGTALECHVYHRRLRDSHNTFRGFLQAALQDLNCELEASLAARATGGAVKAEVLDPPAWGNRFKLNDGTWDLIKVRPSSNGPTS